MFIINNISKSFGDKTLFNNINLTIYDGEKLGIIGANGSGKSTFIKILAGELLQDEGTIKSSGTFAYVKQVAEKIDIDKQRKEEFVQFLKTNKELSLCNDITQEFETLSGGEQTKFMISYALSKNADAILLDEPTNNLDQQSVDWLIEKLNSFKGSVLVVSHDRYFLDQVVDKIYEFENGQINEYYGGYSEYEVQKHEKLEYAKKVYQDKLNQNKKLQNQIKELSILTAKLEKSTKKDGSTDTRASGYKDSAQRKVKKVARQAESKRNRLERLQNELGEKPYEQRNIFYRIDAGQLHNKVLMKFVNVAKSFGDNMLFDKVNLNIENGEKIALIGANGSGKSTFIKMILGQEDFSGDIYKNQNIKIAYLPQNAFDIKSEQTVMEFANEFNNYRTQFLTNLCNMGFTRDIFSKKICNLSSGEKMKLKLNELIIGDFNFLILDEPTNNLDIANKKFLEQVLKDYKGNLLIVSHDKAMLNNISNCEIVINNNNIVKQIKEKI